MMDRGLVGLLEKRYEIPLEELTDPNGITEAVGRKRNCIRKGAEVDLLKASALILEDFKSGRLGKVTLE